MSEFDIAKGLANILGRINAVCVKNGLDYKPRLVAVSKTKSKELIIAAYENGQRHFGENYIKELADKSNDPEILKKCEEIKWHFIGSVQGNKVKKLLSVPGLYVVETVDSKKLASALNILWRQEEPLKVMVQVNTSGEEEKGGCWPEDSCDIVEFIIETCRSLKFIGLMTIGKFGHELCFGPNPDFFTLRQCRDKICSKLNLKPEKVALSMGMSDDFEHAIELGSTSVRVGTAIFGYREPKKETTETDN